MRAALSPHPQQTHHYLYKTPVARRQSSKHTRTRITKRYCQTQSIALHNDRFASSQHISVCFPPTFAKGYLVPPSLEVYKQNFVGVSCLSILHATPSLFPHKKWTKKQNVTPYCVILYVSLSISCLLSTSEKAFSVSKQRRYCPSTVCQYCSNDQQICRI